MIHEAALAGAAFLLAVLWFDLMFDVQVRNGQGSVLPEPLLASIAQYYRRVTTEAWPMNHLVGLVMLVTLAAAFSELILVRGNPMLVLLSLACAGGAIGLAATRTVPNAIALGRAAGTADEKSRLARAIYRDHLICLAAMAGFCLLQILDQI